MYGDENRTPVKIETLPEHLLKPQSLLKIKFNRHHGLDVRSLLRATINNLTGGSTRVVLLLLNN